MRKRPVHDHGSGEPARSGVLRNRSFRSLWVAQAISQTAQSVIAFTLLVRVEQLTRSSIHDSLVVLAFIAPGAIFGPVAGVLVDRADKRRVLVVTNALRAAVVLAYIAIAGRPLGFALVAIYLLSIAFASIGQFFAPAENVTIPLLVEPAQLAQANALFSLTLTSAQLVGYALLGPLFVRLLSPPTNYTVVAGLYFACAALVATLPALPPPVRSAEPGTLGQHLGRTWRETAEIWAYIARQPTIGTAIAELSITTAISLMLGTLGVGLVTQVMGLPASALGFVLAAGGAGLLAGLALVPRIADRASHSAVIDAGLAAMGAGISGVAVVGLATDALLGAVSPELRVTITLAVTMVFAGAVGIGSSLVSVPAQTLLQRLPPLHLRGRVFASFFAISSALAIPPVLFTGALADLVGLREVLTLIGLLTLALAAASHLVRRARA